MLLKISLLLIYLLLVRLSHAVIVLVQFKLSTILWRILPNSNKKKLNNIQHLIQHDSIVLIGDKLILRNDLIETSSFKTKEDRPLLENIFKSGEKSHVNPSSVQIHDDRGIDLYVKIPNTISNGVISI